MLRETPYALLICALVLICLYIANVTYDYGVPQYVSRKIAHLGGGMGYLLGAFLFSSPWWALILSGSFTILLAASRFIRPTTFRGAGGSGRLHAFAEVFFPASGTLCLLNWVWSGDPFLGILPCLYLGLGDMVTGLTRNWHCKREKKGWCGTCSMLAVCLLASYLLKPYWIGANMALVATLVERFTPLSHGLIDDNWTLTLSSALVGGVLYSINN